MKRTRGRAVVVMGTFATVLATAAAARVAAAQAAQTALDAGAIAIPVTPANVPAAGNLNVVLRDLASRAGVVFVGRVESIKPNGGVMEIVFGVQQQVAGEIGDTYTLREWSGRWAGGQEHYRIGQRALVFLYPPNAAGLSSPVDGMAGVVPLIPMGANEDPLLDVRCLSTRVQRPVGAPIADADFGALALVDALAIVGGGDVNLPEPVKRPLPIGLRPRPVKSWNEELQPNAANLAILQQAASPDVEH